ncbi:hypothetical protein D3C71_1519470 [compost metagenome]
MGRLEKTVKPADHRGVVARRVVHPEHGEHQGKPYVHLLYASDPLLGTVDRLRAGLPVAL